MMKDKVLAVDIGTSSVRAMIIDVLGNMIYKAQTHYDVIIVDKYKQEQDPEVLSRKTFETIKDCLVGSGVNVNEIAGMGFSSQMYNIFPINQAGSPLYNMMLWSDSRSEEQAEDIKKMYGATYLNADTGCPMNSLFPITKILWLKEKEENIFQETFKFISIKEFVLHKMIGEYVVDYSMASATGLFDIKKLTWNSKALAVIGISEDKLSLPISGIQPLKFSNQILCTELGLPEDIIIISGGGDGPLANIGSGSYQNGTINVDLGTSGAARIITTEPVVDLESRLWTFALTNELWAHGGILSNVGNGYKWLVNNIQDFMKSKTDNEILHIFDEKFTTIQPGSNDLLFLPYLLKARSPYWDDKIKATIYGLTHQHSYVDIVKAYLESIGYSLFSLINIINEKVNISNEIVFTGGLAVSEHIAQMLADILGKEIKTIKGNEASTMGAAIMTLKAVGLIENYELAAVSKEGKKYLPNLNHHIQYKKMITKYNILQNTIHNMEIK